MVSDIGTVLGRLGLGTVFLLAAILWLAALFLWSAQDIVSGAAFPAEYRLVLLGTFVIGVAFSGLLAATIAAVQRLAKAPRVVFIGCVTVALAVLHGWIDAHMLIWMRVELNLEVTPLRDLFLAGLMPFLLIYGLFSMALALLLSQKTVHLREKQLADARNAAQQAQLAALRFQLNPHFLFNSLNAISSLIVTNRNPDAERMIVKLSDFLRLSLEADPEMEVTLDEELATTQSYLDIEMVRFGARLQVDFQCPTELLDALVPSLLLQPLIENSIKYAVAPARHPVTLSVRATGHEGELRLVVEDDGRNAFGGLPSGSTGLGLANVRRRLAAFYGPAADVQAVATDRGFSVTLVMPLKIASLASAAE